MKRILADRGLGKTSSLFEYAIFLAHAYADEYILYVTHSPALIKKNFTSTKKRNS